MRVLASILLAPALLLASCDGGAPSTAATKVERVDPVELDDIVLRADEAPPGTEYLPERSGTLLLEELWPSDCCPGQQLAFEDAGFSTSYARVFQKPGYSSEPIDTRPGWELVSSAVVLFETEAGAAAAMDAWLQYYDAPVLEALSTEGLGDEAVAVAGSPNAPAERFFLYLWRVDRALLVLRAETGTDTVADADVRRLVDLMDRRIS